MELTNNMNDKVNEILSASLDGQRFLFHRRNHPQETVKLINEVQKMVAQHGMSVSAAKGLFDYMKIVVEKRSLVIERE